MRFEQLEQFVELGQLRHFRQTAENTNISTSALTRSIQTLEDELGCKLVKRSTRSVKLTCEGELFLKYAHNTLNELATIKKRMLQSVNVRTDDKLIIGYTSDASSIVPVSCGQFLAQNPHVKIEMQLQEPSELIRKLKLGEIDISVCSEVIDNIATNIHLPDQLILFVEKSHPLASKTSINKSDLIDYPMYGCFSQSKQIQSMINEAIEGLNKTSSIKVGNIEQVIDGLRKSNHFAITSIEHASVLAEYNDLVQLRTNKAVTQQLVIRTSQKTPLNESTTQLLALFKQSNLFIDAQ